MTKTKDIMTSQVLTIPASAKMTEAYRLMQEKGIRHLPVTDERMSIVGILSDRDIQRAMSAKKLNNFQMNLTLDATLVVEDFMSWPVYVVSESTSIRKIAEEMLAQKLSAFLVQDDGGHLKGIVTTDDLLKLFLNEKTSPIDMPLRSHPQFFFGTELA